MSSSIGMMTFPIDVKIKVMFQTTNQFEVCSPQVPWKIFRYHATKGPAMGSAWLRCWKQDQRPREAMLSSEASFLHWILHIFGAKITPRKMRKLGSIYKYFSWVLHTLASRGCNGTCVGKGCKENTLQLGLFFSWDLGSKI